MLSAGYPLERVQAILGHARIEQTLVYAALLPTDTLRIARQAQASMSAILTPEAA